MSNPELITNIVAKKEGTSVFDISSTDIAGFNDYFTAVVNEFQNHHQIPKEDNPVNVANYLIYVFAKVETCKIRDNDDQNDIHSAMEDAVKRIRGHVYRGTFSVPRCQDVYALDAGLVRSLRPLRQHFGGRGL